MSFWSRDISVLGKYTKDVDFHIQQLKTSVRIQAKHCLFVRRENSNTFFVGSIEVERVKEFKEFGMGHFLMLENFANIPTLMSLLSKLFKRPQPGVTKRGHRPHS